MWYKVCFANWVHNQGSPSLSSIVPGAFITRNMILCNLKPKKGISWSKLLVLFTQNKQYVYRTTIQVKWSKKNLCENNKNMPFWFTSSMVVNIFGWILISKIIMRMGSEEKNIHNLHTFRKIQAYTWIYCKAILKELSPELTQFISLPLY